SALEKPAGLHPTVFERQFCALRAGIPLAPMLTFVSNFFAKVNGKSQLQAEIFLVCFLECPCCEHRHEEKHGVCRENFSPLSNKESEFGKQQVSFAKILKMFHEKNP